MIRVVSQPGELTLVLFHGRTTMAGSERDLGEVMRCCRLERSGDEVVASLLDGSGGVVPVSIGRLAPDELSARMLPMRALFDRLDLVGAELEASVETAVRAFVA